MNRNLAAFATLLLLTSGRALLPVQAQEPNIMMGGLGPQRMEGTAGEISEIKGDTLVLKTRSGESVTVRTTSDTLVRKDREPAKLSDLKVGDHVFVGGEPDGKNGWKARLIGMRTGGPGGPGGMMFNAEDMGKKFIAGEVTKIEETKLTIKRPDGVEQVIEVTEETSFRNNKRESVTLADIKTGDHVAGRGEIKDGTFVPAVLNVGLPPGGRMVFGGPGGPNGPKPGDHHPVLPAQEDKQ